MRKHIALLLAVLMLASFTFADVPHGTIAASGASATLTFVSGPKAVRSIAVSARPGNTDIIYVRLFRCTEASAAATSADIPVLAGSTVKLSHDQAYEPGIGYCTMTYIVGSGTQTFDWVAK